MNNDLKINVSKTNYQIYKKLLNSLIKIYNLHNGVILFQGPLNLRGKDLFKYINPDKIKLTLSYVDNYLEDIADKYKSIFSVVSRNSNTKTFLPFIFTLNNKYKKILYIDRNDSPQSILDAMLDIKKINDVCIEIKKDINEMMLSKKLEIITKEKLELTVGKILKLRILLILLNLLVMLNESKVVLPVIKLSNFKMSFTNKLILYKLFNYKNKVFVNFISGNIIKSPIVSKMVSDIFIDLYAKICDATRRYIRIQIASYGQSVIIRKLNVNYEYDSGQINILYAIQLDRMDDKTQNDIYQTITKYVQNEETIWDYVRTYLKTTGVFMLSNKTLSLLYSTLQQLYNQYKNRICPKCKSLNINIMSNGRDNKYQIDLIISCNDCGKETKLNQDDVKILNITSTLLLEFIKYLNGNISKEIQ